MNLRSTLAALTVVLLCGGAAAQTQTPATPAPATGDATRGKSLFDTSLRCYACHGFDAQTGSPRLVPMARSQEAFLTYVRKPATPGMPSFADVPERDLADVYAYIRTIPQAAPPADTIPLIKAILDRRAKAN
jgi:mono/diheme cytochrome c family protein